MSLVSVIIPARNEEENIGRTVAEIQAEFDRHNLNYEIVIVNDGSIDQTEDLVRAIAEKDRRIRLVDNNDVHGLGNAIKKGLEHFKGDYVIIAMADASDDPKDMFRYIQEVQKGYDCCFGSRWGNGAVVVNYPKHKLFLNRIANWGICLLFGIKYPDVTNAFKCYSRKTIEGIKPILSHHFNITVELPLKAIVRGYSYTVVPTHWYNRKTGKSALKIKEMGSRYLFIILYILLEKMLCRSDYRKK